MVGRRVRAGGGTAGEEVVGRWDEEMLVGEITGCRRVRDVGGWVGERAHLGRVLTGWGMVGQRKWCERLWALCEVFVVVGGRGCWFACCGWACRRCG